MKSTSILILLIFFIGVCVLAQQATNPQQCPPTLSELRVLVNSANKDFVLEKARQTVAQVNQCLQTRSEQDSALAFAEIYHQIGIFHKSKDKNLKEALAFFYKALAIRKRVLPTPNKDLERNYYMIGACQESQGDYMSALTNAEEAYKIGNQIQDKSPLLISACGLVGTSSGFCGDNENAKIYLLKAIDLLRKKNDTLELAATENAVGMVQIRQMQYDSAITHLNLAIILIENILKSDPSQKERYDKLGNYYTNQSIAYRLSKKNDKGLELALKALKMYNQNPSQDGEHATCIANAHIEIGNCYAQKREWSTAFKQYSTALTIFEKAKLVTSPYYAEAYMSMGKAVAAQNDHKGALNYYQKALKVLRPDFKDNDFLQNPRTADSLVFAPMELIDVLTAKATSLYKLARTSPKSNLGTPQYFEATERTLKAIEQLVGSLRLSFVNDGSKYDLSDKMRSMYEIGMNLAKASNNTADFLMWMEKSKALSLQENLKRQQAKTYAGLPVKVLEEEQQLKANVTRWANAGKQDTTLKGRENCQTNYFDAQQAVATFEKTLEKNYPKYYNLKYARSKPLDIAKIQAQLPDTMAFVAYTLGTDSLFTFMATRTQTKMYSQQLPKNFTASLDTFIATQNNNAGNQTEKMSRFAPQSAYFYDFLLKKPLADIQSSKPITRLKIVPDGQLCHLPFDNLLERPATKSEVLSPSQLPYLLQHYAVSYDYSAALAFDSLYQKSNTAAPFDFGAFGLKYDRVKDHLDVKGKKIEVLERSFQEVAKAQKRFASSQTWTDSLKNVSAKQFLTETDKFKVSHFSGHGDFNDEECSLIFSDTSDYILRGSDIYAHEFKKTELMVLSACNTGKGKLQRGEGAMSFARALSYAGIPSTIMTFWSVTESQTSDIVDGFYEHLAAGDAKDVALQKAKKAYLLTGEPLPYYWSGIALMGNTDALTFKKSTNYVVWLLAGGALMGLLIFAFRQKDVSSPRISTN
jgi:CHAT domain-containing protein/tetratricopeptide (TPR) repeat protein